MATLSSIKEQFSNKTGAVSLLSESQRQTALTRAKEAAENMEIAALEEQEMLNTLYGQFDGRVENGGLSYDKIAELRAEYDTLNTEYTNFKTQIAQAITDKGIEIAGLKKGDRNLIIQVKVKLP